LRNRIQKVLLAEASGGQQDGADGKFAAVAAKKLFDAYV